MKRRSFLRSLGLLVGVNILPSLGFAAQKMGGVEVDELNRLFAESEASINELIVKKVSRNSNAYWGKISDVGLFPKQSGLTIKEYHR